MEDAVITPDMTPEEIEAIQNPGGSQSSQSDDTAQRQTQSGNDSAAPQAPQSQTDNRQSSHEGRIAAAAREAEDAKRRADLLEQNNQFLTGRAAEAAAEAQKLREQAAAAIAERDTLARKIEMSTVPTISQAEANALIEEHGEHGAKPFITMRNEILAMGHKHKIELDSLKASTTDLPGQINTVLGKQQEASRASAFNSALMDEKSGTPDLGVLLKDQKFIEALRADPWGKLNPFNAALASNDVSAVSTIRKIVDEFKGVDNTKSLDPGTSGSSSFAQRHASTTTEQGKDAQFNEWNAMLDRGEIAEAQAYASKHKLMD